MLFHPAQGLYTGMLDVCWRPAGSWYSLYPWLWREGDGAKGLPCIASSSRRLHATAARVRIRIRLYTAAAGELLLAARGMAFPQVGEGFVRTHMLCQQLGERPQLFQVHRDLYWLHGAQTRLGTAEGLSQ
jgi:hypothetical protein